VIELRIPLHFVGADACLGVKMQGGAISNVLKEVMVRCVASKLPEFITVDQSKLAVGNLSVHLSDIVMPEGVQLVSLLRGADLAVSMLNGAKG
ncbi:MAG: 50S ribosomal protein L25/general stress protein Ctc, partial [Deefgea sp.]